MAPINKLFRCTLAKDTSLSNNNVTVFILADSLVSAARQIDDYLITHKEFIRVESLGQVPNDVLIQKA